MRNSIWWAGSWGFDYDFARNVVISGDNNTSLSRTDNQKNNFLVLGEGLNDGINDSVGSAEKTFSINFTKSNIKFSSSLHYNGNESYLHVSKKEICKFKLMITCLGMSFVWEPYQKSLLKMNWVKFA